MIKNKLFLLMIFIFLVLFSLASVSAETTLGTFKSGDCIKLIQTCTNCTFANITQVISLKTNASVSLGSVAMTKIDSSFYYNFCNTSALSGDYIAIGFGDPDGRIKPFNYGFSITPNGEDATTGKAVFYIGLLLVLIFFFAISISMFVKFDNLLARVGMFGIAYLLLISITFVGWNMAKDFLTSSTFLIAMLKILFIVLIVGFFPLIIGAFAWYVLMIFKIKEIQRLMDKGFSLEEIGRRSKR